MKKKCSVFLAFFLFSHLALAGDIYGLSQNRIKLISESSELRSVSDNLTIESIALLSEDGSIAFDATYEVLLGKFDSTTKKCLLVSFEYLGSGKHQITEIPISAQKKTII